MMCTKHNETRFIVDKEVHQALSGQHLVDMDGLLSQNNIQHLPGKKLAIKFSRSTPTVEKGEVKVIGRVAFVMEKK
ncbi:hypothetical protein [Vibrio lentus]|uniref:hypothetical protein n=1 Tax=Vibrio lentus TaxID=136468 RepID=UPI00178CF3C1